jgi:hypothetical protein
MFDRRGVDYLAHLRNGGVHHRGYGAYGDYLGGIADLERGIESRSLGNQKFNVRHNERPEPGHGEGDRIMRSLQIGDDVFTLPISRGAVLDAGSKILPVI